MLLLWCYLLIGFVLALAFRIRGLSQLSVMVLLWPLVITVPFLLMLFLIGSNLLCGWLPGDE